MVAALVSPTIVSCGSVVPANDAAIVFDASPGGIADAAHQGHPDSATMLPPDAAVAPIVTITQSPAASTSATTASFTFTADQAVTFSCKLDSNSAAACTSPMAYSTIAAGSHTFTVTGRDGSSLTGSAMFNWTVVPACVSSVLEAESVTPTPANWGVFSGSGLHAGECLESTTAGANFSFTFTAEGLTMYTENGPGEHDVSVQIDNGAAVVINTNASSYTLQNPNVIATGLSNTTHIATVTCSGSPAGCSVDYFTGDCPQSTGGSPGGGSPTQ